MTSLFPWFQIRIFSKLAQRTLFLFVLLAIVPVTAIGLFTIQQTSKHLVEQTTRELNASAKDYGLQLFERLSIAKRMLAQAQTVSMTSWAGAIETTDEPRLFDAIERVTPDSRLRLFGDGARLSSENPFARNADGRHALVGPDSQGKVAIFLSYELRDFSGKPAQLIATLNADYLWQPTMLSRVQSLCVHDATGAQLFCSETESRGEAGSESAVDEGAMLSASRPIFLQAAFGIGEWDVVARQDEATALAPIAVYKRTLLMSMIGVLALIVLLSSIHIRRSHQPLERIIRATRRIAVGRFDNTLEVDSGDEYQELATAINEMSARIGQQFQVLSALGEIDRRILDAAHIDPIMETVLARSHDVLRCNVAAVALFDNETETMGRLHLIDDRRLDHPQLVRIEWPSVHSTPNAGNQHAVLVDPLTPGTAGLEPIWSLGVQCCLLIAVPSKTRVTARFVLGFRSPPEMHDATRVDLIRDFTDRIAVALTSAEREQTLFRQAHYDSLTRLPNRLLFKDRLEQELAHARREATRLAVLFIDLDRFKNINDSLGHTAGDQLLSLAAERFIGELRDVDTIARLGGDEFTVLLPNVKSVAEVSRVCDRLLMSLSAPFMLGDSEYFVGASVGVALYPNSGDTAEDLLRNADTAMYRAKQHARGSYAFYEETMNHEARERVWLEGQLRHALSRNEFELLFQPQFELNTGRIVGAEALLRWNHPERGVICPDRFIHIAEETNQIVSIGEWVLIQACRQLHAWRSSGMDIASISVNVSVPQLRARGFVDLVRRIVRETIEPHMLELEITESTLATDMEEIRAILTELAALGVNIAIDDFGTGYSSLRYLQRLPFHTLKIDRSFMPRRFNGSDHVICDAVLALGDALRKPVVAEGIETAEQLLYLQSKGCQIGQGNFFLCAVSREELTARLMKGFSAPMPQQDLLAQHSIEG